MSYSRWGSRGSGHWYTYWRVQLNGTKETKDNAVFEICGVCSFTAKQLKDNMKECIASVESRDKTLESKYTINPLASKKDRLDELKIYMNEFLKDVDNKYP